LDTQVHNEDDYHLTADISPDIFRAYDIRGEVPEQLSSDGVYTIAYTFGLIASERGITRVIVGCDGRLSSPSLVRALISGLCQSGLKVEDIGLVPSPVLYHSIYQSPEQTGVMLTGSHNPANYNGLKIIVQGQSFFGEEIIRLAKRIRQKDWPICQRTVGIKTHNAIQDYITDVVSRVRLSRKLNVVIDCGHGASAVVAPELFNALGCNINLLYAEVDGHFPAHHPDPSREENMHDLIDVVQETKADVGLAFDGDGDRLGVVTNKGRIIWPDQQMMLLVKPLLQNNPNGKIIFDVKCTRFLPELISQYGGEPIMWKTGHSYIKSKMQETNALFAGEMSGHLFFKENWYGFDDAMYAAVRLLQIIADETKTLDELFDELPTSITTPELQMPIAEKDKFNLIATLCEKANFPDAKINWVDGLRVDFNDGWGLARASNTTPMIVFRFEADNDIALHRIQQQFADLLHSIDSKLDLPF